MHNAGVRTPPAWLRRILGAVVGSATRARVTLLLGILLALLCGAWGSSIKVDTDLRALLPEDAPSVVALDQLSARKGSTEDFILAIEATEPSRREALVDAFAKEIRGWPETQGMQVQRDYTPLRDHALYFLDEAQLAELRDRLKSERRKRVAAAMGSGLGEGAPAEAVVGEDDWEDEFEDEFEGGEQEGGEAVAEGAGDEALDIESWLEARKSEVVASSGLSEREVDIIWPESDEKGVLIWEEEVGEPYLSTSGDVQLIKAQLSKPATDMSFAQDVVGRVYGLRNRLDEGRSSASSPFWPWAFGGYARCWSSCCPSWWPPASRSRRRDFWSES
jgi:hypothetical protein